MIRRIGIISLICLLVVAAIIAYQYVSISNVGEELQAQPSDAIIVLGAGVWPSGPSPALRARIQHAANLYHQGYASKLILSGGLGQHPPSEAEVMKAALLELAVPEEALLLEDQALNTEQNIAYSKAIMDAADLDTAIIVTDVFHLKRAMLIAQQQIQVSGSAVKDSVLYSNQALKMKYTFREVAAIYWFYVKQILN